MDHDHENRAISSSLAGIAFQAIYAAGQFAVLSVIFHTFGPEQFGLWTAVFALTMWVNMLSLGIPRAAMTRLGTHQRFAQPIIRSAVVIMTALGLLGAVIGVLIGMILPWPDWLGVYGDDARQITNLLVTICLAYASLGLPLTTASFLLQGLQRGATRHNIASVTQIVCVLLAVLLATSGATLVQVAIALLSAPVLAGLLQWVAVTRQVRALPRANPISDDPPDSLIGLGAGLWLADVFQMLIVFSGTVAAAIAMNAEGAAPYAATYRLVGLMAVVWMVVGQSYWPAMGHAWAGGHARWIVKTLGRMGLMMLGLFIVAGVGLWLAGPTIIDLWLGADALPSSRTLAASLVFVACLAVVVSSSSALSGMGIVKPQITAASIGILVYLAVLLLTGDRWAGAGVFIAQSIGLAVIGLWQVIALWRVLAWAVRSQQAAAQ